MKKQVQTFIILSFFSTNFLKADDLSISFGGDLGLSSSGQNGLPNAGNKGGEAFPLEGLVSGVRPLWDADLNFANIETVVTSMPLNAAGKKYVFKTHPEALQKLSLMGLNLFSAANNHSYDFNEAGAKETFTNMSALEDKGLTHFAGIGENIEDALEVKVFKSNGYRIAFAAIGILSENNSAHRAGPHKAGTASYRNLNSQYRSGSDFDELLKKLKKTDADLKILSIHYGTEGQVQLDPGQREDFHKALTEGDVDVILGHHAHVVRPWEVVNVDERARVIFYGLGNYLHLGTAAADYGLYGKLFFSFDKTQNRLVPQALKLVPLTETHLRAHPHNNEASQSRINRLNQLNQAAFGANTMTAKSTELSYARSCWGKQLGQEAKKLCH